MCAKKGVAARVVLVWAAMCLSRACWSLLLLGPVGTSSLMPNLVSRHLRRLSAPSCHGHCTEYGWLKMQT